MEEEIEIIEEDTFYDPNDDIQPVRDIRWACEGPYVGEGGIDFV